MFGVFLSLCSFFSIFGVVFELVVFDLCGVIDIVYKYVVEIRFELFKYLIFGRGRKILLILIVFFGVSFLVILLISDIDIDLGM